MPQAARSKSRKPADAAEADERETDAQEFEPVLDIDTLTPKRPTVRIRTARDREGQLYELRLPEDFGIEEEQAYRSKMREYSILYQKGVDGEKLTGAEQKRMNARLSECCHTVLDAPQSVVNGLKSKQKQAVVARFMNMLLAGERAAAGIPDLMANPELMARLLSTTGS